MSFNRTVSYTVDPFRASPVEINSNRESLNGGCYILTGNAVIGEAIDAHIVYMRDNAKIKKLIGTSSVDKMYDNASVDEVF
jgi:hypothetical protein